MTFWLFLASIALGTFSMFADEAVKPGPNTAIKGQYLMLPLTCLNTNAFTTDEFQQISSGCDNPSVGTVSNTFAFLENYVGAHQNTPWAASMNVNLGHRYYWRASFSKAIAAWNAAWEATYKETGTSAQEIADTSFIGLAKLYAGLGKVDELQKLLAEADGRKFSPGKATLAYANAKHQCQGLLTSTDTHFRCGTYALAEVGNIISKGNFNNQLLNQISSPSTGFSAAKLVEIGTLCGAELVAVRWTDKHEIVVPCVIHWKDNHYAALREVSNGLYRVKDSIFDYSLGLSKEEIEEEASGVFLIPKDKMSDSFTLLTTDEATEVMGRGIVGSIPNYPDTCANSNGDGNGNGGDSGSGGGSGCSSCSGASPIQPSPSAGGGGSGGSGSGSLPPIQPSPSTGGSGSSCSQGPCSPGMAVWEVSEPMINLWLYDEPITYRPTLGPKMSLKLTYKQRNSGYYPQDTSRKVFGFSDSWNCSWSCYAIVPDDGSLSQVSLPSGGWREYNTNGTSVEYYSHSVMTRTLDSSNNLKSLTISYPDNSKEIFSYMPSTTPFTFGPAVFLTSRVDVDGCSNTFVYGEGTGYVRLLRVIDGDGRTNTLYYTNTSYPQLVTSVVDPFGNTARFQYDSNGNLTSITDPQLITSSFTYDQNLWMTNLTTPYGTTTFEQYYDDDSYGDSQGDSYYVMRAIKVIDAGGGTNVYMLRQDSEYVYTNSTTKVAAIPSSWNGYWSSNAPSQSALPTTMAFDTNYVIYRNSFHWGPQQAASLPTDITTYSPSDLTKARMKHWLHSNFDSATDLSQVLGNTVAMVRNPSPDGVTPGQTTWYDYDGRPANDALMQGTNGSPSMIARRLPDGTTWYRWYRRDTLGHVTNIVETYSTGYGVTPQARTNVYVYNSSGDVIQVIGPKNETVAGFSYNTRHQPIYETNAMGYVTTNAYDSLGHLIGVQTPTGLHMTNYYNSDGYLVTNIAFEIFRTNRYTYANGLVATHTDERGLTTSYTWDNLRRLVRVDYPDGTYSSNGYLRLDIIQKRDRLGYSTYYHYDGVRHMDTITNALGKIASYSYCSCGALENSQDFLQKITDYNYNNAGWLTNIVYPDGYALTYQYDLKGRVTNTTDSAGVSTYFFYNNQGLRYCVSNSLGVVSKIIYDIEDRPVTTTDANGVTVTSTFDNLDRVLTRTYPDNGVEKFAYNAYGLSVYTNQLGSNTYYFYDTARRKTCESNCLGYTNGFAYNPAGDLTNLVDGSGHKTIWGYDIYGNVKAKTNHLGTNILQYAYDANGRLTNRATWGGTNTTYGYDAIGNLTSVSYQSGKTISYRYDAMSHLTNMVDQSGTSVYSYTDAGLLQSEDGPWVNDVVSYTYNNRLRSAMTVGLPSGSVLSTSYGYDAIKRLTNITSWAGTFVYGYSNNPATEVLKITLPNAAYIANTYDNVARELSTTLYNSSATALNTHTYLYDKAGQRTNQTYTTGNYDRYTYDGIGQLLTASGYESGGTARSQEQLKYKYDAAGNLSVRTNNALVQTFNADTLNQLSTITRTGTLTVSGTASSTAVTNVTVNTTNASIYADATFAATNFTPSDGYNTYTAIAQDTYGRKATNTITVYLPATETYKYDANGNLTNDGVRAFFYDEENQLTNVTVGTTWKVEFVYDGKMRRRITKDYTYSSGWIQTNEIRYVYDGNVAVQERTSNNVASVSYVRGKDLSGSFQGAGGIGGLLARTDNTTSTNSFYHGDGNGNVTCLINSSQAIVAKYLYDAYGNLLSKSGTLADANVYRFSSKEWHENSGLVYYRYRYYEPNLQRWLNRDPLGERGGRNLYLFVINEPLGWVDINGDFRWRQFLKGLGAAVGGAVGTFTGAVTAEIGVGIPIAVSGVVAFNYGLWNMGAAFEDDSAIASQVENFPDNLGGLVGAGLDSLDSQSEVPGVMQTQLSTLEDFLNIFDENHKLEKVHACFETSKDVNDFLEENN